MVDAQGRLVGINTLMNGPDVGVAVPVDVAQRFVKASYAKWQNAQPHATPQPAAGGRIVHL
jgi:S1-C subfamily serine protease